MSEAVGTPPKAVMSEATAPGPTLYVRRVLPVHQQYKSYIRVTVGKLYKVVRRGKKTFVIVDDYGFLLKSNSVSRPNSAWLKVWVWPNGTELEEI